MCNVRAAMDMASRVSLRWRGGLQFETRTAGSVHKLRDQKALLTSTTGVTILEQFQSEWIAFIPCSPA
jgi:hypothetical protein